MKLPEVTVVDFESDKIERRPAYPPLPQGVSIQHPGERRATYYAWGHPEGNNCTREKGYGIVRDVWKEAARQGNGLLFQNAKFDLDVAETHCGVKPLPWGSVHDTLFLLFLHDPHAPSFSLKPSAERILNTKPTERDAVRDWLVGHGVVKKNQRDWGAHICKAPGGLVGKYANGDCDRTLKLFRKLYPEIMSRGMERSYNRERRLVPILLEQERGGIRVDLRRMERDYKLYLAALTRADNWLRKKLQSPDLNLDADQDLGSALDKAGIVTEWTWTKGGHGRAPQRSVSKANLMIDRFNNRRVALAHAYRVRLSTCLSMFFEPWLEMARESDGTIYCTWNQVRQSGDYGNKGTSTSRFSSNPNFQNIPTDFLKKGDGYAHPEFLDVPRLPLMRRYLIPDAGDVWLSRDFSQQELRGLAHFEDGDLCAKYKANPRMDLHDDVEHQLEELTGLELERREVKIVNFSDIYGKGLANLAESLGIDMATAKKVKAAKDELMPGVKALRESITEISKRGEPIRTWGGSEIYAEPAAYVKKFDRVMDFHYRMLNTLIQRSAAEQTKEAIIAYAEHPQRKARFLLTVHDEINSSAPKGRVKPEMKILRECMENLPGWDVPMLSDGESGKNWGELKDYHD